RRDGVAVDLPAHQLVVGDLLLLEAGDAVAADARLVEAIDVAVEESALTGESVPVGKNALAVLESNAPLAERKTMLFTGTTVVRGKALAVVTAIGAATELGKIGHLLSGLGDERTPLEERLDAFSGIILKICLALSLTLMAWGWVRPALLGGEPRAWHALLLDAVALAVAAIPEGLPAITTITLALGMQRMARRGAIVRRLPAVETLGAASIICTDKTGTLTRNQMTVREAYVASTRIEVEGEGYAPDGRLLHDSGQPLAAKGALLHLLEVAALCNNAQLAEDDDGWRVVGDPTEGALLTLAAKGGVSPQARLDAEVLREIPFDSDRKRMTVLTRDGRGEVVAHTKGSADILLGRCTRIETDEGVVPLEAAHRRAIEEVADDMGRRALRVLAFCRHEHVDRDGDPDTVERELTFLGIVGMMDPPRPEAQRAIAECASAGIRGVMITGDHKLTATAIAHELGMWTAGDEAITGTELAALSDEELDARIMKLRVLARTSPEQKLRIVRAFKRAGHVVAMTGDGVNDAPALQESAIGVAMGKGGTDVARQASDLVLSDDNFATIVHAVHEGRAIYRNIQKFLFFLLSANMGLVVAVFTVSFFDAWPPLTPLMVLWINLVTNGAPALALGIDPPDPHLMKEPPRPVDEGILGLRDYLGTLFVGAVMGAAAVSLYALARDRGWSLEEARALAFSVLALSPLLHAFNCRSTTQSALAIRPRISVPLVVAVGLSATIHLVAVLVPALQPVFRTYPVTGAQWGWMLGLSFLVVVAVELAKWVERRFAPG
ncbi:MAG: cation-transporting P-type ATPase, partial [Myxococcota bacterium]